MFQKFEELKKQILSQLENIQNRIVESNAFNSFKEKYQTLPLMHQKFIKYGCLVFVVIFCFSLPCYYYFSSSRYWSEFKEKRSLSLKLLSVRGSKELDKTSSLKFRRDISDIVQKYQDEKFSIVDKPVSSRSRQLKETKYTIKVEHLNIRQAAQLGAEINNLPFSLMTSLTFEESKYLKHYDVTLVLSYYFSKAKKSLGGWSEKKEVKKRPKRTSGIKPLNKKSRFKRKRKIKKDDDDLKGPPKLKKLKRLKEGTDEGSKLFNSKKLRDIKEAR